jgi:hypothetical protein
MDKIDLLIEEMTNEAMEIDGTLHAEFQASETAEIIRLERKLN